MKHINKATFFLVLAVILLLLSVAVFGFKIGNLELYGMQDMRFGIDIRGGVEATFRAKATDDNPDPQPTADELESAKLIIETRMDNLNIFDREITVDEVNKEIFVRFPWKSGETDFNPQEAIAELGETALLTFRDENGNVVIEGKNVKNSTVQQSTIGYAVGLEFDSEGAELFYEATKNNIGKQIGIYMDDDLISAPVVENAISGGQAQITGGTNGFGYDEAKALADKINAGALPFALESSNYSTISPTLGTGALRVMITAGIIAFIVIALFMIIKYRLPGFVACIGLISQIILQILFISVPQITLTLPGMAGIILAVGMGIDANIIISERIKEELLQGKSVAAAIKSGYSRAFTAVLDGNVTTMIVAVVLMIFGSGSIYSFGYTLLTGVILNFLSGILASRLMVTSLSMYKPLQSTVLYGNRRAAK